MADTTFRTVSPALKAVDNGDGTYSISAVMQGSDEIIGKVVIRNTGDTADIDPIGAATVPSVYTKIMINANTEYSQALPAGTKKFTIKTRDGTAFRLAYETGKVATPNEPYRTININSIKCEDNLNLAATTLYFACASPGKVIEIEAWS